MKKSFILLCACFLIATITQSQTTRLIATHKSYYSSGSLKVVDTANIIYRTGNSAVGNDYDFDTDNIKWDTVLLYFPSSGGGYYLGEKRIYAYNAAGNRIDSYLHIKYNTTTSQWENYYQYYYQSNASNYRTQELELMWNKTSNKWDSSHRYTYGYTGANQTFRMYEYYSGNKWTPTSRSYYTFSASNAITMVETDYWNTPVSTWAPLNKDIYVINAAGFVDTSKRLDWDATTSSYINDYMTVQTYNASNGLTQAEYLEWNKPSGVWQPNSKTVRVLDASNKLMSDTAFKWNNSSKKFDKENSYRYSVDATGKIDSALQYLWSAVNSVYNLNFAFVTEHDAQGQNITGHKIYWDNPNNTWAYNKPGAYLYRYYYTEAPVSIKQVSPSALAVKLYPNPAQSFINVTVNTTQPKMVFSITDMAGHQLSQWEETNNSTTHTIPTGMLNTGNYVLGVSCGNEHTAVPFIISR